MRALPAWLRADQIPRAEVGGVGADGWAHTEPQQHSLQGLLTMDLWTVLVRALRWIISPGLSIPFILFTIHLL